MASLCVPHWKHVCWFIGIAYFFNNWCPFYRNRASSPEQQHVLGTSSSAQLGYHLQNIYPLMVELEKKECKLYLSHMILVQYTSIGNYLFIMGVVVVVQCPILDWTMVQCSIPKWTMVQCSVPKWTVVQCPVPIWTLVQCPIPNEKLYHIPVVK